MHFLSFRQYQSFFVFSFPYINRWLSGLGVWFALRVREVPGSNPGWAQHSFHFFSLNCAYEPQQKGKYVGRASIYPKIQIWLAFFYLFCLGNWPMTGEIPCPTSILFSLCKKNHLRSYDQEALPPASYLAASPRLTWQTRGRRYRPRISLTWGEEGGEGGGYQTRTMIRNNFP